MNGRDIRWRRIIQTVKTRKQTKRGREREREIEIEWEMNKKRRSLVQECVRERDGGNIYMSPDRSVLGVHLWRNEISG